MAVISIHYFSSLKGYVFAQGAHQLSYIAIDQVMRFCVPLFIALSGFGLASKYGSSSISWGEFLKRRVSKLIPPYLLWSFFFMVVLTAVPQWHQPFQLTGVLDVLNVVGYALLYGTADYQLYFIPLIVQLYLLFPLLSWLFNRGKWFVSAVAFGFQVWLYWYIQSYLSPYIKPGFFGSDGPQYFWFFTWIWYFVLGIILAQPNFQKTITSLSKPAIRIMYWATLGGLLWSVFHSYSTIKGGTDPLLALRFTKLPIMMYGTFFILTGLSWVIRRANNTTKNIFSSVIVTTLQILGNHSYTLFFAHTVALRIWFGWKYEVVPMQTLLWVVATLMVTYALSRWIEK